MTRQIFQADLPTLRSLLTTNGQLAVGVTGGAPVALALGTKGRSLLAGASAPIYDVFPRRNVVINGNFSVTQRGPGFGAVADNTYAVDRWRVMSGPGTGPSVSRFALGVDGYDPYMVQIVSGGGANKFGIFTVLEQDDIRHLVNVSTSLQAKVGASAGISDIRIGLMAWNGTADAVSADPISAWNAVGVNPTLIAGWSFVNTPVTYVPNPNPLIRTFENLIPPAGTTNIGILIWADDITHTAATDYIIVGEVQYEKGVVCTDLERESKTDTLLRCARYCTKSYLPDIAPATNTTAGLVGLGASGSGSTGVQVDVRFPVPMRASPTLSLYGKAGVANQFWKPTTATDYTGVVLLYSSVKNFAIFTNTTNTDEAFFHYLATAEL